jgi:hypothetical protein
VKRLIEIANFGDVFGEKVVPFDAFKVRSVDLDAKPWCVAFGSVWVGDFDVIIDV